MPTPTPCRKPMWRAWTGLALALVALAAPVAAQHEGNHGHGHEMPAEQLREIRAKVPLYQGFSDEEITANMGRMRPDIGGLISPAGVTGELGVLALAHGYVEEGNRQWMARFAPLAARRPTGYGLGMTMMDSAHIQRAIDELEAAGARRILVLRTETGEANSLNRQWEFIFGRRDESAYLTVPRVTSNAELIWGPTPTAHPIMGEIMLDHARALSTDPARELVIIMGHGPENEADNEADLAIMAGHAATLRGGGLADVRFANVMDDAPPPVRAANVAMIRGWIAEARGRGQDVIVVTNVLTQSSVMRRLERDVDGTGAKFNDTSLMQHPRFAAWIDTVVGGYAPASGRTPPAPRLDGPG
jgi:hypothetical protein